MEELGMAKKQLLTVKQVEKLVRDMVNEGYAGRKNVGSYLYIDFAGGTQSWLFRYTYNEKQQWLGLGSLCDVSLAESRRKIEEKRALVLKGINPAKEEKRKNDTKQEEIKLSVKLEKKFQSCAEEYIELQRPKWKVSKDGRCITLNSWNGTLKNHAYSVIGKMRVQDVTVDHIIQILQPVWFEIPPTAKKLRSRLEKIFKYAKPKGYRLTENPAVWNENLDAIFPKISEIHDETPLPSMSYEEVPSFFYQLHKKNTVASKALMLTILTGVRTTMTRYAQPEQFVDGIWEIPTEIMKKGVEHRIKLSPQALYLVNNLMIVDGWMFPRSNQGEANFWRCNVDCFKRYG